MSNSTQPCPCCSSKLYEDCCKVFHEGKVPNNALELMRSRYSAFALNLPEYVIDTTHPASPQYSVNLFAWKRSISQFSKTSVFQKLEILDFHERETLATVTFTAIISQEGHDATFTERSHFEKVGSRWLYRSGQLTQGHAPNLITTGQLRLLPLAYYGEETLRTPSNPILEITDDIKKLVEEMIETMDACDGVGLAAPQVHHNIRLFVIRTPTENAQGYLELGEVQVFINPTLSSPSDEKWTVAEGCLSIPTLRSPVERPKEISIEYTSLEGEQKKKRCLGWEARAIMHEYDHIEGTLFIDRLEEKERTKIHQALVDLKRRIHDGRAL